MRVYVPATRADLARLAAEGSTGPVGPCFAVTSSLERWVSADGPADAEELELAALSEAARHSLRLVGGDDEPLRVVLAVEVPGAGATVDDTGPDDPPGQVRLADPQVAIARVAALHVDEPSAAPLVRAAAGAIVAADAGDPAAEAVVAALDTHDLLWYSPVELGTLVG